MAISLRDERYRWLALLLYGLAAFIVAILLVFSARWIYRSVHHTNKPTVQQPVSTNKTPKKQVSNNPASSNPSQPKSSTNSSNNGLPNNGPGDVAALFIGTSLAAAGLHYLIQLRRLSN